MSRTPHIDCTIPHAAWRKLRAPATLARLAARSALAVAGADELDGEISIVLSNDATVQHLNAQWRGKDQPTNVLSFAAHDAAGMPSPAGGNAFGDIILAFETCKREAMSEGKPVEHHMAHLVVHGVLHLLGYDHLQDRPALAMMDLEIRALAFLAIPDPYNLHSKAS